MRQLSGEALTVLDQSAARKSQVPSKGDKETKTEEKKGRGMLGQSTDTVEVVRSQEITNSKVKRTTYLRMEYLHKL